MAFLGKNGFLSIKFRQAAALITNAPRISALEAYEASDLKRCVDAIADITHAVRDESGSFQSAFSAAKEEEPLTSAQEEASFRFRRATDAEVKGIALDFDARHIVKKVRLVEHGQISGQITNKGSGTYNFVGDNINHLKIDVPDSVPLIGGKLDMMPDDRLAHLLSTLSKAAPSLLEEITKRTGLEGPAPEPEQNPFSRIFFDFE